MQRDPDFVIPQDGLRIVAQYLSPTFFNRNEAEGFEGLGGGIKAMTPHKIYETDLDGIYSENIFDAAIVVGWRYVLFSGDQGVAAAEIAMEKGNKNLGFSRLVRGPDVEATVVELQQEEIRPKVADDDYELRFLRIWDVSFWGLWLHCYADAEKSFVIPLPPVPQGMEIGEQIPRSDFIRRIKAVADGVRKRFLRRP
jgi:hypothetical protein